MFNNNIICDPLLAKLSLYASSHPYTNNIFKLTNTTLLRSYSHSRLLTLDDWVTESGQSWMTRSQASPRPSDSGHSVAWLARFL